MPAKDLFNDNVRNALEKDCWTITDDPLTLRIGRRDVYVDIGAEKLFAAEKADEKIAVEIKSFIGRSEVADLQDALGQFIFYEDYLSEIEPGRVLFLAVRHKVFIKIFKKDIGLKFVENKRLRLLVFDEESEVITEWIK